MTGDIPQHQPDFSLSLLARVNEIIVVPTGLIAINALAGNIEALDLRHPDDPLAIGNLGKCDLVFRRHILDELIRWTGENQRRRFGIDNRAYCIGRDLSRNRQRYAATMHQH